MEPFLGEEEGEIDDAVEEEDVDEDRDNGGWGDVKKEDTGVG